MFIKMCVHERYLEIMDSVFYCKWLLCCDSNTDWRIQSPLSWPLDDKEEMVVLPGHAPGSDAYKAPALLLSYRTRWHPDFDSNKDLRCWRPLFCRWTIGIWRCTQDSNLQAFRPTDFKSAPSPPGHAAYWLRLTELNRHLMSQSHVSCL